MNLALEMRSSVFLLGVPTPSGASLGTFLTFAGLFSCGDAFYFWMRRLLFAFLFCALSVGAVVVLATPFFSLLRWIFCGFLDFHRCFQSQKDWGPLLAQCSVCGSLELSQYVTSCSSNGLEYFQQTFSKLLGMYE